MRWIALLLVAAFAACADETPLEGAPLGWGPASSTLYPPGGGTWLLGDWIICTDASCTSFTEYGLRFQSNGTWTGLQTYSSLGDGSGPGYCVSEWSGTYSWAGARLAIDGLDENGHSTCRATFDGDVATLEFLRGTLYLDRVSGEQVEQCPAPMDAAAES